MMPQITRRYPWLPDPSGTAMRCAACGKGVAFGELTLHQRRVQLQAQCLSRRGAGQRTRDGFNIVVWTLDVERRSLVPELNWAASRPRPEMVGRGREVGMGFEPELTRELDAMQGRGLRSS